MQPSAPGRREARVFDTLAARVANRDELSMYQPAFFDLRTLAARDLRADFMAALTVTFLSVPQGLAYAMIAGLPPVMGLYASFIPTIVGSLFRSSRHVVTGPSNALSLLVGTAVAAAAASAGADPTTTALILAVMVGAMQAGAGLLKLGVLVDYISVPVVAGYITGAGTLIAIGQLPNLTATSGGSGTVISKVATWIEHLGDANTLAVGVGLASAVGIVAIRKLSGRRLPAALLVLAITTLLSWALDFGDRGLLRVAELAGGVPTGLPPFEIPDFAGWQALLPFAVAATVLSLVESSSVARTLTTKTGQELDLSTEFTGQGLANIAAGFFGGYPTSASLSRSAMNERTGARTRLAGALGGVFVGATLLFAGPVLGYTPIAALAGLLLVVAFDLVDLGAIRTILSGRRSDAIAFIATVLGTWMLPLDQAIYLGVALSLFFYLRRARLLHSVHLKQEANDDVTELHEAPEADDPIRILEVTGQLFFAAARELESAIDAASRGDSVKVLFVRIRHTLAMDVTIATRLAELTNKLQKRGVRLVLSGVSDDDRALLERTGALAIIGPANVYGVSETHFGALKSGIAAARDALD